MKTIKSRTATVKIRENDQKKQVKITSGSKPEVPPEIIRKWQSLLDITTKIAKVPTGLIMRLHEKQIEVFLKSNSAGNPYKADEKADLSYGLYCETVIGTQKKLLVPDARKDPLWSDNNPDIELNMISYLGFPLNWPDGEVFGTVCLLDNKKNYYGTDLTDLLDKIKGIIESDLEKILEDRVKQRVNEELTERVKELTCLFALSHLKEKRDLSQEDFLQAAIELLPPAWHHPQHCCARIMCCGKTFASKGFKKTPWKLKALIPADQGNAGEIEVFYLKNLPPADNGPFLKEEQKLLETFAINIGLYLERTSSEQALRRSREDLRTTLNSIGDAVITTDTAGRITGMNPVAEKLTGWTINKAEDLLLEEIFHIVHAETGKRVVNPVKKVLKTGKIAGLANHTKLISQDGSEYQIDDSGAPIMNNEGNITGVVLVFRDITSNYRMQEKLAENENRFRELFENMGSCVAVYQAVDKGRDFVIIGFNKAAEKAEKINRKEILGKKVTEVFPGVIDLGLFEVFKRVWKTGNPEKFPVSLYRDDRISGWRDNYVYKLPSGDVVSLYEDVTEKKLAEDMLEANYSLLRIAGQCAKFGGWSVDLHNNICTWSDAVADIHEVERGYSPSVEDAINFYARKWREKISRVFRDCAEKGIPYDEEMEILTKKGKRKWVRTIGNPVRDENGKIVKVQGAFQDISERKQAEETYQNLFQNAQVGLFRTRIEDGKILESNEKLAQMFGYDSREEFVGNYITSKNYADPGTREKMLNEIRKTGEVINFEARFKRKDQSVFWSQYTAKIFKDKGWIEGVVEDISVRKDAEQKLAHSHDLMRYIIEHANSAVAVHDRDMRYIYVSQQYLDQYNIKDKDIIGKHHYDVFPDLPKKWRDIHQKALKGEVSSADRDPYYRDDGSVEWTRWECRPWFENDGSVGGLIIYTAVITDDVLREQALKESEEKYRLIVENANDGIEITQQDKIIFSNQRFADMLGYDLEELKDMPFNRIFTEKAILMLEERHQQRKKGLPFPHQYETTFRKKDDSEIDVSVNHEIIDYNDKPATFAIIRDITEEKQADMRLKASEEKYRHLFETMDQGVVYQNAKGEITSANPAAERILGLNRDQIQGKTSIDQDWQAMDKNKNPLPGEKHPAMIALETGKKVQNFIQGIYNPKTKNYVWIIVNSTPLFYQQEKTPYGVYSTFLDITDRIRAEEELENSEKKLKSLFENMTEGFALHKIILDSAGKPVDYIFLEVNPAYEKMTGLLKENIIGKPITAVLPGIKDDPVNWIDKYSQMTLNSQTLFFEDYSKPLKKWFIVSAFSPEKYHFATIIIDITEKKKAENELLKLKNELESRVNDQTRELKEKISELERFRDATIDREFRMKELRDEIDRLKKEIV